MQTTRTDWRTELLKESLSSRLQAGVDGVECLNVSYVCPSFSLSFCLSFFLLFLPFFFFFSLSTLVWCEVVGGDAVADEVVAAVAAAIAQAQVVKAGAATTG